MKIFFEITKDRLDIDLDMNSSYFQNSYLVL